MKFAAILATISAVQVSAIEENLKETAPVCKLDASPRCVDDAKWACMSASVGVFMTFATAPAESKVIDLGLITPTVSVCQPVDKDSKKTVPVDYTLTMKVGTDTIATGVYKSTDFKAVSGAQALVATAAAALSAVYMM
jgi:hypothetical protein